MCCFTGHVSDVSATNIFARVSGDREHLVYEMTFSSDQQTAMILPIPTADESEDAVEFVPLDNYADFFRDLEGHFDRFWSNATLLTLGLKVALKVHVVGAFEASFVPRMDLFDRLDPRFRIPRQIWDQLPAYRSFGFVVFKLQPGVRVSVHPMAFSFRTRETATLFFPTVHIHDGALHETAAFDHILYTQNKPRRMISTHGRPWMSDRVAAGGYLDVSRTRDLVDADAPCYQASFVGIFPNSDVVIPI